MKTIMIALPEEHALRLDEMAREAGLTTEELLRAGVERLLSSPGTDFAEAAAHVLKKNASLYQRLA